MKTAPACVRTCGASRIIALAVDVVEGGGGGGAMGPVRDGISNSEAAICCPSIDLCCMLVS